MKLSVRTVKLFQNHPQRHVKRNYFTIIISEDDFEIELKHCTSSHGQALSCRENISCI